MTNYMKNAGMLRDLMRIDPDIAFDMIEDAFVESGFNDVFDARRIFSRCANTTTDDGMELCIVSSASDASSKLDMSKNFEDEIARIISEIDKGVDFVSEMWWK